MFWKKFSRDSLINPINPIAGFSFLEEWFIGPLGLRHVFREVGYCIGPLKKCIFHRGVYSLEGFRLLLSENKRFFRDLNLFLGIGFLKPEVGYTEELKADYMLYDRLVFDFDQEGNPGKAVDVALKFARRIKKNYGADGIVVVTGLKGAHVVVPLAKPTDWEGYSLVWKALLKLLEGKERELVDYNMLQYNRLDRIPFTWNVKEGKRAYVRIITPRRIRPEEFSWSLYSPLDVNNIVVVKVLLPEEIKPKRIHRRDKDRGYSWIWKVVKEGLSDGRHRFLFHTLIPYLANIKKLEDSEIIKIVKDFVDNSCNKKGNCGKIYDSWIRSSIKSAKRKDFKPMTLKQIERKDPELYRLIINTINKANIPERNDIVGSTVNSSEFHHDCLSDRYYKLVVEFTKATGQREFSYEDLRKWLMTRQNISADYWHSIERRLRLLAEKGCLGRKYLIDGSWIDYGSGAVNNPPPSREVRFYLR